MSEPSLDPILRLAIQRHRAGQISEAEHLYQQILSRQPNHVDALHLLGMLAAQTGRAGMAVELIGKAILLKPMFAEAHNNLGNALYELRRFEEAAASYSAALGFNPGNAHAHYNLANALREMGRLDEAVAEYLRALAIAPNAAEIHNNLGNVYEIRGQYDDAIASCSRATRLKPDYAEAYNNLGNALNRQGKLQEAIVAYETAIRLTSTSAQIHINLANAHLRMGKLDEAISITRKAIELDPGSAEAYDNLANTLKDQGKIEEAVACYRRALELKPDDGRVHSNWLYTLLFHPGYDPVLLLREHLEWGTRHGRAFSQTPATFANDSLPDRPLRIGYVSPEFREHVVGDNLLPLFREHDHGQFKIFCYSNVLRPDSATEKFRAYADNWRNIVGQSPEQVAQRVRDDRIDILVDLTLHMGGNSLAVFARKPAPIQVTFAGYPGGTGLAAMDYRLTDPYLDPPGASDAYYAEKSIRLPHSFWCYDPATMCGDDPVENLTPLPAIENGFITFGCLNNFCKVNSSVLHAWARVLKAVPFSRLIMLTQAGSHRQDTLDLLAQNGIEADRIEFLLPTKRPQYLAYYQKIDVSLDTFPYNGHTSSLDSCWMGVPVVTMVGNTVVGRAGLSQLSNLGLTELAADTLEQYVSIAVTLARDLPRLQVLRQDLRNRMLQSPLTDAKRFARDIEAVYRNIWREWCLGQRMPT